MSIDYRFRNIVIAAALAAAAVLLTVVYVSTARDNDAAQRESVTVYVPTRSFPIGTAGSKIAGSLEATTVTRAAMAPKAVTDSGGDRGPVHDGAGLRGRAAVAQPFRAAEGAGRPREARGQARGRSRSRATPTRCSTARCSPVTGSTCWRT